MLVNALKPLVNNATCLTNLNCCLPLLHAHALIQPYSPQSCPVRMPLLFATRHSIWCQDSALSVCTQACKALGHAWDVQCSLGTADFSACMQLMQLVIRNTTANMLQHAALQDITGVPNGRSTAGSLVSESIPFRTSPAKSPAPAKASR